MPETPSHNLEKALSPESHSRLLNLEKQILILTKGEKIDSNDTSNNESILNSLSDKDKDKLISLLETYDSVLKGESPPMGEGEEEEKENEQEKRFEKQYQLITDPEMNSPEAAEAMLKAKGIYISEYALDLLQKTEFSQEAKTYNLVEFTVKELGLSDGATTDEIYQKAESLGLELCPAEVGPQLRLSYTGTDWKIIAMKQISARGGYPGVFELERGGGGLRLRDGWADSDGGWFLGDEFVFCSRK